MVLAHGSAVTLQIFFAGKADVNDSVSSVPA